jgi:type VI secretion system protein ImpA
MSEQLGNLSLAQLCMPIDGGSGDDLSFSDLFDQIKEARRADPGYLTQGDWQADLKVSDWDLTVALASAALAEQTKDLMLSAWLAEGLAHTHHFSGVAFGLRLTEQLLAAFWPSLHPALEEGMELRTARLAWLNHSMTEVVGRLPITQDNGYGLARYEESKQVENQKLQDPASMASALSEGKINAEIFQRSAASTNTEHLQLRAREISECLNACHSLQDTLEKLIPDDTPSFSLLYDTLTRSGKMVERLLHDRGIELAQVEISPRSTEASPLHAAATAAGSIDRGLRTNPLNREEAFQLLTGVAAFFKQTEPHSPVPYLVERAIKWGNMPLEAWLADVIKDTKIVDSVQDILGTKSLKAVVTPKTSP